MTQRWLVAGMLLGLLTAPALSAQVRQISGQVTNAQTGQGVPEVDHRR